MQLTKRGTEALMAAMPELDVPTPWETDVNLDEVLEIAGLLGYDVLREEKTIRISGADDAQFVISGILQFYTDWTLENDGTRLCYEPMLKQLVVEENSLGGLLQALTEHDLWTTEPAKLMCQRISAILAERRGAQSGHFDLRNGLRIVHIGDGIYDIAD